MTSGGEAVQSGSPTVQRDPSWLRWGLIVLGLALCAVALVLLDVQRTTSVVREAVPGTPTLRTTTTSGPVLSDTVFLGILGLGAILLLAGAFFNRITKVMLPGGAGLDLAEYTPPAAGAVTKAAATGSVQMPSAPEERAATIAAATNLTAVRGAQLSQLAKVSKPQLKAVGKAAGLPSEDIADLAKTGQPSDRLWGNLATDALQEVASALPG